MEVLGITNLGNLEANKSAFIAELTKIALCSPSEGHRLRSIQQIARLQGWNAAQKIDVTGKSVSIHALLSDPKLMAEALGQLSHEPGEAAIVYSEAREALPGD